MVPGDVAVTSRLVDGKAWPEAERIAKLHPGEVPGGAWGTTARPATLHLASPPRPLVLHL
jgi:hypothetical protein